MKQKEIIEFINHHRLFKPHKDYLLDDDVLDQIEEVIKPTKGKKPNGNT